MEKEFFKKFFSHLAEEMEGGVSRVKSKDIRDAHGEEAKGESRKWAGHVPDVVDFLRRCETVEQAEEVIEYMEARGEVTPDRAVELRRQLREEGLDSFGGRKEEGFYHKNTVKTD